MYNFSSYLLPGVYEFCFGVLYHSLESLILLPKQLLFLIRQVIQLVPGQPLLLVMESWWKGAYFWGPVLKREL